MKKMMILFSSLIFVGLGMTACSKEGSKKQPNFRNRHQPLSKTQAGERGADPFTPTSGKVQNPDQVAPLSSAPTRNDGLVVCNIQTDPTKELPALCDAVRVALVEDKLEVFTFENATYNQRLAYTLPIISQEGDLIVAKKDMQQALTARKVKILQIMKDNVEVDIPDEQKAIEKPIQSDELLRDIENPDNRAIDVVLNAIKIQAGEQFLVITNIDKLTEASAAYKVKNDLLKNNKDIQADLTIVSSDQWEEALILEEAFANSHLAQLSYRVEIQNPQDYTVSKVSVGGGELTENQYHQKATTAPNRIVVRVTDLNVFAEPNYEVLIELTRK